MELPREADELAPEFFCRDCRARIAAVSHRGFILADLYDLTDIHVYSLSGEASYSIRGYDVSVSRGREGDLLSVEIPAVYKSPWTISAQTRNSSGSVRQTSYSDRDGNPMETPSLR